MESAWTCHCHVYVSLANQQCKQTGNLANSVTYKLHKQKAYLYMTHYHALEIAHDIHWQYLCWVVSRSFHAMLCKCFPGNKSRILKEHAAIKICKWMCWSSNLGERNIFKDMPTAIARSRPGTFFPINHWIFRHFSKAIFSFYGTVARATRAISQTIMLIINRSNHCTMSYIAILRL